LNIGTLRLFETFDEFVEVLKMLFEMQEADRDKLLIREQCLLKGFQCQIAINRRVHA
jgi:hypothetical protein